MEQEYKEELGVGIVVYVLNRNRARLAAWGIDFDEGLSAGLVGLAKGIANWKESLPISFFKHIYQAVWTSIFDSGEGRSLRRNRINSGLKRIQDAYYKKTGRQIGTESLASLLDADVKQIKNHLRPTHSLESYSYIDDTGEATEYFIPNKNAPNPLRQAEQNDFVDVVQSILDDRNEVESLTDEEEFIIKLHFGIGISAPVIMKEISRLSGLSTNTVGRRLISGLKKLSSNKRLQELYVEA